MSRLYYLAWLLLAAVLFFPTLAFVLVNRQPLNLDLLVAGWQWQVPAGIALVIALVVGAALGLLAGLGIRAVRSGAPAAGGNRE